LGAGGTGLGQGSRRLIERSESWTTKLESWRVWLDVQRRGWTHGGLREASHDLLSCSQGVSATLLAAAGRVAIAAGDVAVVSEGLSR